MPELDLSTDIVRSIIDNVHEFHSGDDVNLPGEEDDAEVDEDTVMQFAADYSDDPYYEQLTSVINDLETGQQVKLVALMWVGRGDYGLDEWDDALAQAAESWNERTAEYLLSTPLVSDYLAEGLEIFETAED